jgi:hypothetical protein
MTADPYTEKGRSQRGAWDLAIVLLVLGVALAVWLSGLLDKPLSTIGLQHGTCAVLISGEKLCNAELRAWCSGTDDLRQQARGLGIDASAAQRLCDEARN